ncbi:MAG: hypothetical protein A2W61_02600 [Deltaproteobacteria bacterium RIFCSPLOWO2_01_44_7]|nr:MAG: hypothetical protein A3D22_01245 [Deltaproteobacteria bacterium RIFCSPHIGHO2_02_FULL_44_53]OGQ29175.1 MAG: hypothetical protein A3D98_05030 [Deltaproteobacteria bacterium RIFCSPHIGHO2_12_FULL_44_21]OGQ44109.1 MAG: hypothetical protein A2W61_02600 [Deltaproteobacteria bacterium RIFCSPLOWO2_01_44_7]OGQ71697.1 MAG: hypothetical protein A3F82_01685 [Deltaproteobacteria bacterium RIFCSPLOWO2_12_FULL_44_12]
MELKRMNRSGWEYFLIISIVGFSLILSVGLYAKRDRVFKERLLILELSRLRSHVIAYMLEYKQHPSDLKLWTKDYGLKVDPFGNPYHYDPRSGWVSTTTPSHKHW